MSEETETYNIGELNELVDDPGFVDMIAEKALDDVAAGMGIGRKDLDITDPEVNAKFSKAILSVLEGEWARKRSESAAKDEYWRDFEK